MQGVQHYERECVGGENDGIEEINDLGAAATLIAEDFRFCGPARHYTSRRRSCRRMCICATM